MNKSEEIYRSLVTFLRDKRKEQGRTQEELAQALGVNKVTYNTFENFKGSHSFMFLFRVANELGFHLGFSLKELEGKK